MDCRVSQGGRWAILIFIVILTITVESSKAQDSCFPDPCLNGGQCFRWTLTTIFCDCFDTGYHGINCEINDDAVQCPDNQTIVKCILDPCAVDSCPLYPDAECRQNVCGECSAEFFVDDVAVNCTVSDGDNCPDDSPRVECLVDPCYAASCPSDPEATCRPDYCGGCNARFYDEDDAPVSDCRAGSFCAPEDEVLCMFDPCQLVACEAHPEARCQLNNCGMCAAVFYDGNNNTLSCNLEYTCEEDGERFITGDIFVNNECRQCVCAMGNIMCQDNFVPECTIVVTDTTPTMEPTGVDCASLPCANGGTCIGLVDGGYLCLCAAGYMDAACSTTVGTNACDAVPCLNGGTCAIDDDGTLSCSCPASYGGPLCEVASPCLPSPCLNGGLCTVAEGQPGPMVCVCPSEYTGYLCHLHVEDCADVCQNGATCSLLQGLVSCDCPAGYAGEFCQFQPPNPCFRNPCANGGQCVDVGETPICNCPPRFTGVTCQDVVPTGLCDLEDLCQNDGVCLDLANSFVCVCLTGFTGVLCEMTRSVCDDQPCRNGGTCSEILSGDTPTFSCECPEYIHGATCEVFSGGPCETLPNLCINGYCIEALSDWMCLCYVGFVGESCDIALDPCLNFDCRNGGSCSVVDGNATCLCPDGFIGGRCDSTVSPCTVNPCFNDGVCSINDEGTPQFVCSCPANFEGDLCQTFVQNPCFPNMCVNGLCVISNVDKRFFHCLCDAGFIGVLCDTPFDPCQSNPCRNGASCLVNKESFYCNCTEDFLGVRCDRPVLCNPSPCFNNGVCRLLNGGTSSTCDCPYGLAGNRCQVNLDPCLNNECVRGSCVPYMTGHSCVCDEGYSGITCNTTAGCDVTCPIDIYQPAVPGRTLYQVYWDELQEQCSYDPSPTQQSGSYFVEGLTPILVRFLDEDQVSVRECVFNVVIGDVNRDGCDSSPCLNGGSCLNLQGSMYTCSCAPNYTGKDCETVIPIGSCDSSPCQNDGFCVDRPDGTLGYACGCQQGFIGARCEVRDDSCASTPCRNGATCTPDGELYRCTCAQGYLGGDCAIVAPCSTGPCLNGGHCFNRNATDYLCFCIDGYTGGDCETPGGACASYPCRNGATCDNLEGGVGSGYSCECPPGLVGLDCGLVDPCFSEPCFGSATCVPEFLTETHSCLCSARFTGARCDVERDCDLECPADVAMEIDVSGMFVAVTWESPERVCDDPVVFTRRSGSLFPVGDTVVRGALLNAEGVVVPKCNFTVSISARGDLCASAPCSNGGLCIRTGAGYDCECTPEYTGPSCDQPSIPADVTPPRLDFCPSPEARSAPMQDEGAVVFWERPEAMDDSGSVTITYRSHAPGTFFPFGSTQVRYGLSDHSGNTVSCVFVVTVSVEVSPPKCVPQCPGSFIVMTESEGDGDTVYWNAASGACNYTVMSSHLSGGLYPLGSQTVTLMFKEGANLVLDCSFTFTLTRGVQELCAPNPCLNSGTCQDLTDDYVCMCPPNFDGVHCEVLTGVDNVNPVVSYCPSDVEVLTEEGAPSAPATWRTPRAVDNSGTVTVSRATHQPDDVFLLGVTTVTYEFCDPTGNKVACQFRVIVDDPTTCGVRCPDDVVVYVDSDVGFVEVSWEQPLTMCDRRLSSSPLPGSFFEPGATPVTVMLFDDSESVVDLCVFTVAVLDANQGNPCDNPMTCNSGTCVLDTSQPMGFRCECTRCNTGKNCERALSLADPCGPDSQILCKNGGICSFTDCIFSCSCPEGYGGQYCDVELLRADETAPTIIGCPVDISRTTGATKTRAVVTWDPIRFEDASGTAFLVSTSHESGDEFPLGITTVTSIYSDASMNYEYCRFLVLVQQVGVMCDTNICLEDIMIFNTARLAYMEVFWEQEDFVCGQSIVSSPRSGDLFSIGETQVTWTMYDEEGIQRSACIFFVIVTEDVTNPCFQQPCINGGSCFPNPDQPEGYQCLCSTGQTNCRLTSIGDDGPDRTAPVIRRCNDREIYVETGLTDGIEYTWLPPVGDDNSGTVYLLVQSETVPFFFPIGRTPIYYLFEDGAHNTAECTFDITVVEADHTPPLVTYCPDTVFVQLLPGEVYTTVNYSPPEATDLSGYFFTDYEDRFAPGSLLQRNEYQVVYTFTDGAVPPNTNSCEFTIIVHS